eukprot:gene156-183_t
MAFNNPSILEKLIAFCEIKETGSNIEQTITYEDDEYYDQLEKRQREMEEQKNAWRSQATTIAQPSKPPVAKGQRVGAVITSAPTLRLPSLVLTNMATQSSSSMSNVINPALMRPISLVLHGNQYLESLKKKSNNDAAKRILEGIKISMKDETTKANKISEINAKDWLHGLHSSKGTGHISLSRSTSPFRRFSKDSATSATAGLTSLIDPQGFTDLVLVSSEQGDKSHQAWRFTNDHGDNGSLNMTAPNAKSTTPSTLNDYLLWRKIALGDVRTRFQEALERMRDFTILHIHQMDLIPKASHQTFLNNLAEAENFIHMDVMVTTKKDLDRLYDFLNLSRDCASTSQSRVALQVLNSTMCTWLCQFNTFSRPSSNNPELNEKYQRLSNELHESLLDSMICSTNNLE